MTRQGGDCGVSGKKMNFLSPPSLWYPWVTGIPAGFASGHGGASYHDFSHKQSLSIPPVKTTWYWPLINERWGGNDHVKRIFMENWFSWNIRVLNWSSWIIWGYWKWLPGFKNFQLIRCQLTRSSRFNEFTECHKIILCEAAAGDLHYLLAIFSISR